MIRRIRAGWLAFNGVYDCPERTNHQPHMQRMTEGSPMLCRGRGPVRSEFLDHDTFVAWSSLQTGRSIY